MVTDVEFCLLGPVTVRVGGVSAAVPPGKQRAVLAALLLNAGRVVSLDGLADVLWGDGPPPSAGVTTRNHVKRLRQALGPAAGPRVSTEPRGYLIRVEAGELDLSRFEAHLDAMRVAVQDGAWETAAAQARAGLALWHGEPLADVESELLAVREVPRLGELRLEALEARIRADLQLGGHAQVITELRQLAAVHPTREQVHGLLMLALYRDGRQAEALAAYQYARQGLITELGAEPGSGLRDLHQRMLAADPALALPRSPRAASNLRSAVPRELPAGVRYFTGRTEELRMMTGLLEQSGTEEAPGTVVISAIGGTAGAGKTALALHFAHQVAHRFGDGQLYVNLRGFDPSGVPATPAETVRGFLDALRVPPERIPARQQAQAALYRSLVADKRMLIVLDNARDEGQVRPLLPASPASLVIVTSRNQLTGLAAADGALLLNLDILTHDEAVQLLTARIGASRAAAETEAIDEIARLCAHLPLALAVAAARAAARPRFPLTELAAELRDTVGRLDALDAGPADSVRAVFSWSYQQLSPDAARMFRLLGLHPGPDISVPAAASLAAAGEPQARQMLHELARDCLITEHSPRRYTFHDLLRAYAADKARDTDPEPDRDAAIGRVLDHYLHTAYRARLLLLPTRPKIDLAPPKPGAAPEEPADHRQALAWFDTERRVLLAAVTVAAETGADSHAWQLPCVITEYLYKRGYPHEHVAVMDSALAAATRLDDPLGQATSLRGLASACASAGDYDQARAHLERCLPLYQQLADRQGEAVAQQNLAAAATLQGRYADSLGQGEQALRLFQAAGDEAGEAEMLNNIGYCHALLGDYQQARELCEQSLGLIAKLGGCSFEHIVWDTLGYIELQLGNLARATEHFETALGLCRYSGDRLNEASILTHAGDARRAVGDLPQARHAWQQALAIYDDIQHPHADEVRARLAKEAT